MANICLRIVMVVAVKVDKKHGSINVPQNNEPIRHYFN